MGLRLRLWLIGTLAMGLAAVAGSAVLYVITRHEMRGALDRSLVARAARLASYSERELLTLRFRPLGIGGAGGYAQVVSAGGVALRPEYEQVVLPITAGMAAVAAGRRPAALADATIAGTHVRLAAARLSDGRGAIEVARPLTDVDRTLRRLALVLALADVVGILLVAGLSSLVATVALRPLRAFVRTVARVKATGGLSLRVPASGRDEIAQLARLFNDTLQALEASQQAQRRLVADASHELRTPLTSLRTNHELLALEAGLEAQDRERLHRTTIAQLDELTGLVSDLIELARGRDEEPPEERVRFDRLVAGAVERARLHRPGVAFELELEPIELACRPQRAERAVANLLDNAGKWSPPGQRVRVRLDSSSLRIRDRGPGIEHADLPFVFDRFYRSQAGRSKPGSGLGLAIVREIALMHGWSVSAANLEDGGAEFRIDFSPAAVAAPA